MGLFKVPLMKDESLTSFTSRLAHANARSARELCTDYGLSWNRVVSGTDQAITRIAELSGIDRARLDAAAVKRCGEKSVWVAGEATPFMFYQRGVMKFCPACFAADEERQDIKPGARKHLRKIWHSRFIRTCPVHARTLVSAGTHGLPDYIHDVCWSLDYLRRDITVAARGSVPQEFTPFEQYALSRLRGTKPGNTFLDNLPLFVAGDVCELAGLVALHGKKVSVHDKTERQRWEACTRGFEIFGSGLAGFHRFLDDLSSQCINKRASRGGNELFGKFHEILTNRKIDVSYEPVKEAARAHAFANLPLTDGTTLFGKNGNAGFVSFSSLEKKHGLSEPIMRKYFKTIGADIIMPGTDIAAVPADEVEHLVATMRDLIRGAEAAKTLGVTVSAFDLLVASGLVATEVARDESAMFSARYSRKALIELRDGLLAMTTTEDLNGLMPIKAVGKSLLTTLVSILRLLLNGSIRTVGVDPAGSGIMSLMLDRAEVAVFLAQAKPPTDMRYLTADDLAVHLRASPNSIYYLIKEGHIETVTRANAITGYPQRVATMETARIFWEKHVTLSECCKRADRHHAVVRRTLAAAGIDSIYKKDALREQFYPRTEAMTALGMTVPDWADTRSKAF
ncbi:MAG: TniQ family protein [Alphaproteobacteria bacterium]|nr:TniQ family protein [Alphaproteobacteria bacterium]MBU4091776.1 TniQ family protein [Alphaproteobacteria bacterium]